MALNLTSLATRWGKLFGGVNAADTFRGTTIVTRADTIAALYDTAAEQRNVTSDLYAQTTAASDGLGSGLVTEYLGMAQTTLEQMCLADSGNLPVNPTTVDYLNKLVADMLSQAETFEKPTVTIGGSATNADGTSVTTPVGVPYGNGVLVGTVIDPLLGTPRMYVKPETLRCVCQTSSYVDGVTAGTETFGVFGTVPTDTLSPYWPDGSGANTSVTGQPSSQSNIFSNAYFDTWTVTDTPDDWTLANLIVGTSITRSTDYYVGSYACQLTAAPLNAELYQTTAKLVGGTNYLAAIRVKRPGTVTGGVLTVGLRTAAGTYLTDALGNDLKFTVALTGAAGDYLLTKAVFSLPRGFASPVILSLKVTTAMVATEAVRLATVELIPMTSAYTGGPDLAVLPGSVGFAVNDTYSFAVANSGGTGTFVGNLERVYGISSLGINVPVSATPTQDDTLIS